MTPHSTSLLLALAAILIATKILGEIAQRVRIPAVIGELLAGIVLGPSLLHLVKPDDPVLAALGELGVLILLFQIGLHTDLRSILRVGLPATGVGLAGIALPFVMGFVLTRQLGYTGMVPVVCAAALTATSIGISARVLSDVGMLKSIEGNVVLGAAVLDDIVGLIILSVIGGVVQGASLSIAGIAVTAGIAVGFVAAAILVGGFLIPPFMRFAARLQLSWALGAIALALALVMAGAADWAGSATIIGALAAGLVLHATPQRQEVEEATATLGHFFVPIFFVVVGASINLASLGNPRGLMVGGGLIVVGIIGKFLAGFVPFRLRMNHTLVGVAMIPRGEVGLIFAQMGLASGVLDPTLFSAVALMVLVTTFVAPLWLGYLTAGGRTVRRRDGR
jgi:Kef-type K+ transport system membrane component KefB